MQEPSRATVIYRSIAECMFYENSAATLGVVKIPRRGIQASAFPEATSSWIADCERVLPGKDEIA